MAWKEFGSRIKAHSGPWEPQFSRCPFEEHAGRSFTTGVSFQASFHPLLLKFTPLQTRTLPPQLSGLPPRPEVSGEAALLWAQFFLSSLLSFQLRPNPLSQPRERDLICCFSAHARFYLLVQCWH